MSPGCPLNLSPKRTPQGAQGADTPQGTPKVAKVADSTFGTLMDEAPLHEWGRRGPLHEVDRGPLHEWGRGMLSEERDFGKGGGAKPAPQQHPMQVCTPLPDYS